MLRLKNKTAGFTLVEALIVLALVILLVLVGWFVYQHRHKVQNPSPSVPTIELTISRNTPTGAGNFKLNISSSSAIVLFADIKALKPSPAGTFNCPLDYGVEYILKFTHPTLQATADPTGCQAVMIDNKSYSSTTKLWNDIIKVTPQPVVPANPDYQVNL